MKTLFVKNLSKLQPVDQAGEELLHTIKNGEMVMVEVKRPRNVQHHRLYFALIKMVWDNLDHDNFPKLDNFHDTMKIMAGVRIQVMTPNERGKLVASFAPGSISFSAMKQAEFSQFFDKCCEIICKHFMPGNTPQELKDEVYAITGIKI
jgi:hypothetical protein